MKKFWLIGLLLISSIIILLLLLKPGQSSSSEVEKLIVEQQSGRKITVYGVKAVLGREGYSFGDPIPVTRSIPDIPFSERTIRECPGCVAIAFSRRLEPTLLNLKGEFSRGWMLVDGDQVRQIMVH